MHDLSHWVNLKILTASLATITESGSDTAGESYTLICTAAVGSQREGNPNLMWFGPHDSIYRPITNSTSDSLGLIIETTNTTTTFTSSLKFLPLQSKHNGTYTCEVNFQGKAETRHKIVNVKGNIIFIFIILNDVIRETMNSNSA